MFPLNVSLPETVLKIFTRIYVFCTDANTCGSETIRNCYQMHASLQKTDLVTVSRVFTVGTTQSATFFDVELAAIVGIAPVQLVRTANTTACRIHANTSLDVRQCTVRYSWWSGSERVGDATSVTPVSQELRCIYFCIEKIIGRRRNTSILI